MLIFFLYFSIMSFRHTLAEVKTECMVLRAITDKHIEEYANGDLDQQSVSMIKVEDLY